MNKLGLIRRRNASQSQSPFYPAGFRLGLQGTDREPGTFDATQHGAATEVPLSSSPTDMGDDPNGGRRYAILPCGSSDHPARATGEFKVKKRRPEGRRTGGHMRCALQPQMSAVMPSYHPRVYTASICRVVAGASAGLTPPEPGTRTI